MCSPHDATASHEEVARLLSRRGFLRTAAVGAAVVGASGALATPAAATGGSGGGGGHRVPRTKISIQLYTLRDQLAIGLRGHDRRRSPTSATNGRARRLRRPNRRPSSRRHWTRTASGSAPATSSSRSRSTPPPGGLPAGRAHSGVAATSSIRSSASTSATGEVVRDTATWAAYAHDLNRAGKMARDVGAAPRLPQPQLGVLPAHGRPVEDRVRRPDRRNRPRYVHFEMDLFWVTRGARDPVDLLRRLGGRVRQFHVKDMNQAGSFEDPGQGLHRLPAHLPQLPGRCDEYIVERDDAGTAPRSPPTRSTPPASDTTS